VSAVRLLVSDSGNACIRRVDVAALTSSTAAGVCALSQGVNDGAGSAARFLHPTAIVRHAGSTTIFYVADNGRIRRFAADSGLVSTLATLIDPRQYITLSLAFLSGGAAVPGALGPWPLLVVGGLGTGWFVLGNFSTGATPTASLSWVPINMTGTDSVATAAGARSVTGQTSIVFAATRDNFLVAADFSNVFVPAGTPPPETPRPPSTVTAGNTTNALLWGEAVAGNGFEGDTDDAAGGLAAQFEFPACIVPDLSTPADDVIVCDGVRFRRVVFAATSGGGPGAVTSVTTTAEKSPCRGTAGPTALVLHPTQGLAGAFAACYSYVANATSQWIGGHQGARDGNATEAAFNTIGGLLLLSGAGNGDLLVADTGNACLRRVSAVPIAITVAGTCATSQGVTDGVGPAARFVRPSAMALEGVDTGSTGRVFVADSGRIRLVTLGTTTATVASVVSIAEMTSFASLLYSANGGQSGDARLYITGMGAPLTEVGGWAGTSTTGLNVTRYYTNATYGLNIVGAGQFRGFAFVGGAPTTLGGAVFVASASAARSLVSFGLRKTVPLNGAGEPFPPPPPPPRDTLSPVAIATQAPGAPPDSLLGGSMWSAARGTGRGPGTLPPSSVAPASTLEVPVGESRGTSIAITVAAAAGIAGLLAVLAVVVYRSTRGGREDPVDLSRTPSAESDMSRPMVVSA